MEATPGLNTLIAAVFIIVLWFVYKRRGWLKRKYLEPTFMAIMFFGIFALVQPLFFWLYSNGFTILMVGTFGYIAAIHFK
ncbi:MAG: hypothetical protein K9L68_05125 [Spirochaetales bacterium]|nr:hypothetical protein [Spirochaetales bacterium]MCF7937961.1 hypothetical protein [Spirochaetales bacterium]